MTEQLQTGTEQRPVTTQLTSKRIKLIILVGGLLLLAGIIMIFSGNGDVETNMWGILLVVFGIVTSIVGKFLRWWKHS